MFFVARWSGRIELGVFAELWPWNCHCVSSNFLVLSHYRQFSADAE